MELRKRRTGLQMKDGTEDPAKWPRSSSNAINGQGPGPSLPNAGLKRSRQFDPVQELPSIPQTKKRGRPAKGDKMVKSASTGPEVPSEPRSKSHNASATNRTSLNLFLSKSEQRKLYKSEIKVLQSMLDAESDPKQREGMTAYLKNVLPFRGLRTEANLSVLKQWAEKEEIHSRLDWDVQLEMCRDLLLESYGEDKYCGVFFMQKYLVPCSYSETMTQPEKLLAKIGQDKCVPAIRFLELAEDLFQRNAVFDWSTSDRFSMGVLAPLINIHGENIIKRITSWAKGNDNIWQKRAAVVPLRAVVKQSEYIHYIFSTINTLLPSSERFIQTGIGWTLADLSKANPKDAEELVEKHFDELSAEVIARHTKHLPKYESYKKRKSKRSK